MCATRRIRISAANIGPNQFHQNRTVSWLMSIPRSANRSSTLRSDGGYRTYIITTRRMTSGELLKYRNGLLMRRGQHRRDSPKICSDTAHVNDLPRQGPRAKISGAEMMSLMNHSPAAE